MIQQNKQNRYIALDLETTGLSPIDGDKIIEVGCVEIIENKITGDIFHQYVNPGRKVSQETIRITKITDEILKDKPDFSFIENKFMNFLNREEYNNILVIHNANFDLKFLYNELNKNLVNLLNNIKVIDTLKVSRRFFPNEKANLDNLCKKFQIDLSSRNKNGHGALLDSNLLGQFFIKLLEDFNIDNIMQERKIFYSFIKREFIFQRNNPCKINEEEKLLHENFLSAINIEESNFW